MNILITGAGGMLGGHLGRRLGTGGHSVFGLIHDHYPVVPCDWATLLSGDVTDYRRMLEIIVDCEIDQIYHCASKAVVRNCNSDPINCFQVNVMGTVCLLEAARQAGRVTGILCMESDKSYGNGPIPYREDQALRPGGIYEASKAAVSGIIPSYHATYGLPVCGVRSANIYGPGDRHLTRIIPNTITRLLKGQKPVMVDGAAEFLREYVYVEDAARYAVDVMAAGWWGQSVNVGSGETINVRELLSLLCKMLDRPDEVEVASRSGTFVEIPKQRLDLTLLRQCVAKPVLNPVPLAKGLQETISWYRQNHKSTL